MTTHRRGINGIFQRRKENVGRRNNIIVAVVLLLTVSSFQSCHSFAVIVTKPCSSLVNMHTGGGRSDGSCIIQKTQSGKRTLKTMACKSTSSSEEEEDDNVGSLSSFSHHHDDKDDHTKSSSSTLSGRRRALEQMGGISLASYLLLSTGTTTPAQADDTISTESQQQQQQPASSSSSPQTIVMTGANSGIGFEACKRLMNQSNNPVQIVLACRTLAKAQDAVERLQQESTSNTAAAAVKLIPAECNLASLSSIRTFVKDLPGLLSSSSSSSDATTTIQTLCLNAGIARNTAATDVARTDDGFELTVGTNHFGHFYLNHLLYPKIDPKQGKIVVTASGVHDPASPGGAQGVPATLGTLQGLETMGKQCEMIDGSPFNADKAYKDSKLCNVLFTREYHRRLQQDKSNQITVNCFNPGLIVSTGLFRDQNPFFIRLFDFAATDLFKVGETPAWGGGCLTYMIQSEDTRAVSGEFFSSDPGSSKYGNTAYGNQFHTFSVSQEAQDNAKAQRLWELSQQELGITQSTNI